MTPRDDNRCVGGIRCNEAQSRGMRPLMRTICCMHVEKGSALVEHVALVGHQDALQAVLACSACHASCAVLWAEISCKC